MNELAKRIRLVITLGILGLSSTSCALFSPSDPEEVEARRVQLDAKLAVRRLERLLMKEYLDPAKVDTETFIASLRTLERDAEADAFSEFLERYLAGSATYERPPEPNWRICEGHQYGGELIRRWGNGGYLPESGRFPIGTIAATFKIESAGDIEEIRVILARHPAAAWLIIDTIAEARVSRSRLKRLREESPQAFPVKLCAWWDYNEIDATLTPGRTIRGLW